MGKRTFRIRPLGMFGSLYEVDRAGFAAFLVALLCAPAGIALEAYARNHDRPLELPILAVATLVAGVGIAVAVLRGKKV